VIVLKKLLCSAASHTINRHRVWHDGVDYRTRCSRCGTEMLRAESGWRAFDHQQDDHPERLPHPRKRQTA